MWLTSESEECVIDDGSGLILIDLRHFNRAKPSDYAYSITVGEYWMFIGPLRPHILTQMEQKDVMRIEHGLLAHQMINLNDIAQERETFWFLEVTEYWRTVL